MKKLQIKLQKDSFQELGTQNSIPHVIAKRYTAQEMEAQGIAEVITLANAELLDGDSNSCILISR